MSYNDESDPQRAPQPTLLAFHGGPHGFFGPGFQGDARRTRAQWLQG